VNAPVTRETLGRRLRRVNRYALLAAMGFLAIGCIAASFALGLGNIVDASRVQARILSENLSAAILFQDEAGATDVLRSVRFAPGIESATLLANDGVVFSQWRRDDASAPATDRLGASLLFRATHVEVSQPVLASAGSRVVGRLHLTVDLAAGEGEDAMLSFKVCDTGVGLPAGRIEELFSPFLQADASTSRRYGGSGLGNKGGVYAEAISSHGRPHSLSLTLPPLGALLLSRG